MKKILESKTKIRFQDCDPFNHLNNAAYINYFFNAREDQLVDNYDLDIYKHARKTGLGWVVASNQISYLKPAFTMETIVVQSQLISFSPRSLQVELRMYNEQMTELKSVMWSKFAYFDMLKKAGAQHSEDFMTLFEGAFNPVSDKIFEDRVKTIITK